MPVSNELLEYQQVDAQLRKIEQELSSSEERKKYVQAKKFMEVARDKLEAQDKHAAELRNLRDELAARVDETTKPSRSMKISMKCWKEEPILPSTKRMRRRFSINFVR